MTGEDTKPQTAAPQSLLKGAARIQAYLKTLPDAPGVYRMLNAKGDVLYVGKAKSLKKRVASYAKPAGHTDRIARMIAETAEMLFVTTASETEALLLESNLIKRLKPRYNVSYRDDKSFPNILLREDHAFPQLLKHRGAKIARRAFISVPSLGAGAVNRTLEHAAARVSAALLLGFGVRGAHAALPAVPDQALQRALHRRASTRPAMRELVKQAEHFLTGKSRAVQDAAGRGNEQRRPKRIDFERAARLRDRIRAMSHIQSHQGINPSTFAEADVFAVHQRGRPDLHPGVLLPRRPELGQPALFPAP